MLVLEYQGGMSPGRALSTWHVHGGTKEEGKHPDWLHGMEGSGLPEMTRVSQKKSENLPFIGRRPS